MNHTSLPFILSLDLGVASVGWALIDLDREGRPVGVRGVGSHLFDAGIPAEFLAGKDEPPAKPRRDARQLRKMIWRRARRKRKLLRLLQQAGLMPEGPTATPADIDRLVKGVDAGRYRHPIWGV